MHLWQLSQGYRYNSDSLMLYDFISRLGYGKKVLDVGCGCGILGALLKRDKPEISLTSLDIQPINITITNYNFEYNNIKAQVLEGDFLKMQWEFGFDTIISNPPFYHEGVVKSEDEHMAKSRYNQYLPIDDFFLHVKKALAPRGKFYFCYDAKQIGSVMSGLAHHCLNPQVLQFVHPKLEKNASLVLIEARKNSKSLCQTLAPIIVNSSEGCSPQAQAIFTKANTKSFQWE